MAFTKMSKQNLALQILNETDNSQKKKIKIIIELTKDEFGGEIMPNYFWLRAKTYSYLIDEWGKIKKCDIKRKLKFDNCKDCLEATQLENKINHLKIQIEINSIKKS